MVARPTIAELEKILNSEDDRRVNILPDGTVEVEGVPNIAAGHGGLNSAAPAVVVRVAAQVGQNRSVEMQFGVPLDMTPKDLNAYMDKITSVMDRQNNKGLLEVARASIEAAKKQLATNSEQRGAYEAKCRNDFALSNRRGDFKATESQRSQLGNFDGTTRNLKENIIPKFERDIEELERKINEGV